MTTVRVEVDPDTGEYILPLPQELLEDLGWDIGDTLEWGIHGDNAFSIKKVKASDQD